MKFSMYSLKNILDKTRGVHLIGERESGLDSLMITSFLSIVFFLFCCLAVAWFPAILLLKIYGIGFILAFVYTALEYRDEVEKSGVAIFLTFCWPGFITTLLLFNSFLLLKQVMCYIAICHQQIGKIPGKLNRLYRSLFTKKELPVEQPLEQGAYRNSVKTCKWCGKFQ